MPTYRYECTNGHPHEHIMTIAEMEVFEIARPECHCGAFLRRNYSTQKHVKFHEGLYEHVADDPMYISSAQQLVDECRKRDNTSQYMADMGGMFGAKENRWI
jgi:hypothetical protein